MEIQNDNISAVPQEPKQFVICDDCHWCATAINTRMFDPSGCPSCHKPLSAIPIGNDDRFAYNYSEKRGVELAFSRIDGNMQANSSKLISYA
jgi:hypothetical protein